MYKENSDVKQRLIEIGRKEFLEQGYVKASMRNISAAANVTTGAIYFFFHNKEDFFRAILGESRQKMVRMGMEIFEVSRSRRSV